MSLLCLRPTEQGSHDGLHSTWYIIEASQQDSPQSLIAFNPPVLLSILRHLLHKPQEETMEHRSLPPLIFLLISPLLILSLSGSAQAYKNYTVGDSLGWYDNTEKANVNYQKWADAKNFSLGDFLSKFSLFHSYIWSWWQIFHLFGYWLFLKIQLLTPRSFYLFDPIIWIFVNSFTSILNLFNSLKLWSISCVFCY